MTPTPPLLTTGAAGKYAGVSGATLRRWANEGRLRHVRLPSGRLRFLAADLDAAMKPTEVSA